MKITFEAGGGGVALKLILEEKLLVSTLVVEGTMVGGDEDEQVLETAFEVIDQRHDSLTIDAKGCRVGPEAELPWARLASKHLRLVTLRYMASDLALLMQNCPEYTHERSRYDDPA